MQSRNSSDGVLRFGNFEADLASGELHKHGVRIKLQLRPFQILQVLLERPGQVVTREELQKRIWSADTFVDFDHGLNNAIRKLRAALADDAENPRYIETLAKRGYRFIAEVRNGGGPSTPVAEQPAIPVALPVNDPSPTPRRWYSWRVGLAAAVAFASALALTAGRIHDRWSAKVPVPRVQSIAVLPLQNLSADSTQEYFSDGMTDALITDLAQVGSFKVISRTSSMQYKGTTKSLPVIGRELNVDGIVEGTVQRSGDRVRITAQLIYAPGDKHLWARSYDREVRDSLQLQEELARDIAQNILSNVADVSVAQTAPAHPLNVAAYDDFLKGRNLVSRWIPKDLTQGEELLERSIRVDPNFAPAYAAMANAYYVESYVDRFPETNSIEKAEAFARKALILDEHDADAHCLLGMIYGMHDWHWSAAELEFRKSIQSDPSSSFAHAQFAYYLVTVGKKAEAVQEIQTALEIDPYSPMMHATASQVFLYARKYEDAKREAQRAVEIDSTYPMGHHALCSVLHAEGKLDEATAEFIRFLSLSGEVDLERELEAAEKSKVAPGGPLRRFALIILKSSQKKPANHTGWTAPMPMASAYTYLGDKDKAIEWLNRACDERSMELWAIAADPDFDPLRSDPRFDGVLRRIGLKS